MYTVLNDTHEIIKNFRYILNNEIIEWHLKVDKKTNFIQSPYKEDKDYLY